MAQSGRGAEPGYTPPHAAKVAQISFGPELFDALGIVRTEEHLAAIRYYGMDIFFTSAVDFGYSKRLDETLEKWDYQMLLEDMVHLIRRYRPHIIISRFQGNRQDGHGAPSSVWGCNLRGVPCCR